MAQGVEVPIVSTFNGKGIQEAQRELDQMRVRAGQTGGAMQRLGVAGVAMGAALGTAAVQAGAAAARMAIDFGVDGVKAFMDDEAAAAKLAKTMSNLGMEGATAAVEKNIDALQRQFGVADDLLRPAMGRLLRVTGDTKQATELLTVAMDVSAGTGRSLESVTQALSRAASGSAASLGKIVPELDKGILKTGDMDAITRALSVTFSGQAKAASETFAGSMAKLSVGLDEVKESFGRGFVSGLTSAGDGFNDIQATLKRLEPAFESLGRILGKFTSGPLADVIIELGILADLLDRGNVGKFIATLLVGSDNVDTFTVKVANARAAMQGFNNDFALMGGGEFDAPTASSGRAGDWASFYQGNKAAQESLAKATANSDKLLKDYVATLHTTNTATGTASVVVDKQAAALERLKAKIDAARQSAQDGIKAFDDYASSASGTIMKLVSIDDAATLFEDRNNAVKDALRDLVDYQATLSAEQTDAEKKKVAELQAIYQTAQTQAAEGGASIVDTFVKQAEKVAEFGRKMQQLLAAGLNETSFKEISAMSLERGIQTADAFLDGNISENIRRTNDAVGSVKSVADQVGLDAAKQFASAGIQMAVAMIEALMEAIGPKGKGRKALAAMMDDLAASMNRTATIYVSTVGNSSGVTNPGVAASSDSAALANLAGIGGDLGLFPGLDLSGVNWGALSGFADGGMASGTFLVGEAGPEIMSIGSSSAYITPNSALGGNNYSITVNAGVGDPREIGRSVVQYIKRFEQASGPVFASA